ncbi:ATP5H [Bugula neritina]|uniref:ATP5H n=1 Tax=Bugula neritina TaxID=10212 RepID=A0A7J7IVT3_BUGNE|nr:ATP5H [Bugula neritina]
MAQAARRVSKSAREVYRALKNRSDYFINKVHSNPESLGKIDFAHYKTALPGLKMVDEFEQAYGKVSIPYPKDPQDVTSKLNQEETKTLADSANLVKQLESEKVLSALYLKKLDELPKLADITMEMFYDYFPWTNPIGEQPKIFPFTPEFQPENATLNESAGFNRILRKIGLNIKV